MGLREHFRLLQAYWWLIALALALTATAAAGISATIPLTYKASTRLMVYQAPAVSGVNDYTAILTGDRLVRTFMQALQARPLLDAASAELGLAGGGEALAKQVGVQVIRDTQVIVLTVEDSDPARAAALANTITGTFIEDIHELNTSLYAQSKADLERQLTAIKAEIAATQARLLELNGTETLAAHAEYSRLEILLGQQGTTYAMAVRSLENVRAAEAQTANLLHVIEPAVPPTTSGGRLALILLAGFAGGALTVIGITLRDYLDTTVRSASRLGQQLGRPVLASVVRITGGRPPARLVLDTAGESAEAAAYALVLARLQSNPAARLPQTLLVTSSRAGEGKTTTALNLAATMAQAGLRVVIVDADMCRPSLHTLLACANRSGLTTLLRDEESDIAAALVPAGFANLRLLPAGPATANPARLLLTPRMAALTDALAEHADVVLIDGPALLTSAEGPLLVRFAEATLLVVRHGATPAESVAEALVHLEEGPGLAGALLNDAPRAGGRRAPRSGARRSPGAPALEEPPRPSASARMM